MSAPRRLIQVGIAGVSALLCIMILPICQGSDELAQRAYEANNDLTRAFRISEGSLRLTIDRYATGEDAGNKGSRSVTDVRFFTDQSNFRMDATDVERTLDGVEQPLVSRVVSTDETRRMAYELESSGYAYIRFKNRVPRDRQFDPRFLLNPNGRPIQEAAERLEQRGTTMNAREEGDLIIIVFKETNGSIEVTLAVDMSLGGAIVQEKVVRDGRTVNEVVRSFTTAPDSQLPVPSAVTLTRYAKDGSVSMRTHCAFKKYVYRDSIPEETFSLVGMGVPEGTRVVDRTINDAMYILGETPASSEILDAFVEDVPSDAGTEPSPEPTDHSVQGEAPSEPTPIPSAPTPTPSAAQHDNDAGGAAGGETDMDTHHSRTWMIIASIVFLVVGTLVVLFVRKRRR